MKAYTTLTSLVLATSILFPQAASAQTTTGKPTTPPSIEAQKVTTTEGKKLVDEVKKQTSPDGAIKLNTAPDNLNWENASALEIEGTTVVTVPLKNEGTQWSNLTVTMDPEGQVQDYTEGHFKEISSTSGRVTVYQNGKLASDRISEAKEDPIPVTTYGIKDAISELNSCLSAAGIPAWVVAGATAACSAAGGWAGILACYTAAGVAGGTVGYCSGKAAKKL